MDKTEIGFEMVFSKSYPIEAGSFVWVGPTEAKVENIADGSKILFLRGYRDVKGPKKLVNVYLALTKNK